MQTENIKSNLFCSLECIARSINYNRESKSTTCASILFLRGGGSRIEPHLEEQSDQVSNVISDVSLWKKKFDGSTEISLKRKELRIIRWTGNASKDTMKPVADFLPNRKCEGRFKSSPQTRLTWTWDLGCSWTYSYLHVLPDGLWLNQ